MNLGFITDYNEERVVFAGKAGFDGLEVSAEMGSPMDFNNLTDEKIDEIKNVFAQNNVKILTIQCAPNHLERDPQLRKKNNDYFIKSLRTVKKLGTNIVMTNAWADPDKSPQENIKDYKEVFSRFEEVAREEGVYIAIENCPHWLGYPTKVGNIAFSPEMWDALLEAVPSPFVGLEFDPSHLHWQGMDYIKLIKDYAKHIIAFHAKDTEILTDELNRYGIIGKQLNKTSDWDYGWWRYRIPGWGSVNWRDGFRALYDINFAGPMVIEHEDPVFSGNKLYQGLSMGLKHLKQFV